MTSLCIADTREHARFTAREDAVCFFSWIEDGEGKCTLTALSPLAERVATHFQAYEAKGVDPISQGALAALDRTLAPCLAEHGYTPDIANRDFYRIFLVKSTDSLSKIDLSSTVLLKTVDNYQNLTTIDLPAALRAGCVAYGYIEDGRIISVALTHTPPQDNTAEITLETACGYRGLGYAKAALASLTAALTARGISVYYRTRSQNEASARTALAVGYRAAGRYYRYLGRRGKNGL